jgi:ATP/maltotriose-dependent transcriptional regulator MalT
LLYDKQGALEKAKEKLVKSVDLAERGRIVAYFVELGKPMEMLISKMPDEFKERSLIKEILKANETTRTHELDKTQQKATDASRQKEKLTALTSSELKVLKCIAAGLRNQEIADKLFNSEETIKKHIYHMFQKLEVKNRLSLVTKAKEEGILG